MLISAFCPSPKCQADLVASTLVHHHARHCSNLPMRCCSVCRSHGLSKRVTKLSWRASSASFASMLAARSQHPTHANALTWTTSTTSHCRSLRTISRIIWKSNTHWHSRHTCRCATATRRHTLTRSPPRTWSSSHGEVT